MSPVVPPIPVKAAVHAVHILVLTVVAVPENVALPVRLLPAEVLQVQAAAVVLEAGDVHFVWVMEPVTQLQLKLMHHLAGNYLVAIALELL